MRTVALLMLCACTAGTTSGGGGGSSTGGGASTGGGVSSGGGAATGGGTASGGGGAATGGGSATGGGGSATGGGGAADAGMKSPKRGIAYDLASAADVQALSGGVSWFYDWGTTPHASGLDYYPMLWNGTFDAAAVSSWLHSHPEVHFILVMNEPNLTSQSNLTPQQAAAVWPKYEAIADDAGVQIVGPQITWGTMPNYGDPVEWLDAFYSEYQNANGGRDPRIDVLGFHWYDYGLSGQLDRLTKYNKHFWVTEMANWHSQNDGAQIDTLEKQKTQMTAMVQTCESRSDVDRYAWFTGRWSPDPHFDSLLADAGELTELGQLYVTLPY
ncbi:MAG: glycosyl hydrolase [Myxococcaceae bacterium]